MKDEVFEFVIAKDEENGLFITSFADNQSIGFGAIDETEKAILRAANLLANREIQLAKIGRLSYASE